MSVKFEHVSYVYDASSKLIYPALEDINFSLDGHFFCGVVGHTGSGKSTLIQQINALLRPSEGRVIVGDFVVESGKKKLKFIKELRKYAGLVFQFPEYQLFEESVLKDVAFGPKNFKVPEEEAREKAKSALKAVGIDESYFEKSPFELSGGEKRRVAIAGMIALDPQVLILDEPTAGLDPQGAKDIMKLFNDLYQKGTSIIIVTHDMDLVLKYCDSVITLSKGNLLGKYTPSELFYNEELLISAELYAPDIVRVINNLIARGIDINKDEVKSIEDLKNVLKRRNKK